MKNKLLLLLLLTVCMTGAKIYGQATDSLPSILNPEKKAEFSGGPSAWIKFLIRSVNHDLMPEAHAPHGSYKIIGNFLIDTLGKVTDIRIETDPGYGAANEFKRVINLTSGKWIPAYDNGKAVPYRYKQSITLINN